MKFYRPELYALAKSNGIKGCCRMKKKDLIELLRSKGLIEPEEPKPEAKKVDTKHRLRGLWKNPRAVTLRDLETGEIHKFPSTYQAAKFIGKNSAILSIYNGKDWKGKYHITLSEAQAEDEPSSEGDETEGREPLEGLPAPLVDTTKV